MYAVSAAFKAAVRQSHKMSVRAEVWRGGEFVRSLEPLDGSVDIDSRRSQRRTCSLRVAASRPGVDYQPVYTTYAQIAAGQPGYSTYAALKTDFLNYAVLSEVEGYTETATDDGLIPQTALSDLSPFGNELVLWRGVEVERGTYRTYASVKAGYATYLVFKNAFKTYGQLKQPIGSETVVEEVPLGVFVITDVDVADSPAGKTEISIQGVDRSIKVAKASWVDPLVISNGTNVATAISSIVSNRYPSADFNFLSTSASVTGVTLGLRGGQSNPWQDAQRLAESAGLDLYFDGEGTCVLRELPNPSEATPVDSYEEGADNLVLTATRRISSDNTYNGVIVTGEGSRVGTPVRAAVFDEDPASPTYRYGLFGDRPFFLSSPTVTTSAAAAVAAAAKLSTLKGAEENVEWTQVCDPSLDVNDVITVSNTGTRLNKVLVLDRLTVPLAPNQSMSAVARTVRSLATDY